MDHPLFYAKSWFRAKKRPTELWSTQQAQAAHVAGAPYTVLVDSPERPYCFLEVTPKFVGVSFLDELLRETLTYQFRPAGPTSLFLSMATHREYQDTLDKILSGTTYLFDEDGTVRIRREQFSPHQLDTAASSTDVSANYTPVPSFGEYQDLLRVERSSLA